MSLPFFKRSHRFRSSNCLVVNITGFQNQSSTYGAVSRKESNRGDIQSEVFLASLHNATMWRLEFHGWTVWGCLGRTTALAVIK